MKTRDQIEMIDLETGKEGVAEQNFETEEYKTAEREQAEQEISEL